MTTTRIFLVARRGNGTPETPFAPNTPEGVSWAGYTVGTKFLCVADDNVPGASELTAKSAIKAAAKLYGITPAHLGYVDGPSGPFLVAAKQLAMLAIHAPSALLHRVFS